MSVTPTGLSSDELVTAHASGLWVADGWTGVKKSRQATDQGGAPSHRLVASVVNTDRRLPAWLRAQFGGALYRCPRDGNRRTQYRWDAAFEVGYAFLSSIRHLVPEKLPPLLISMAFRDHKRGWRRGVKLTAEEIEMREAHRVAASAWNRGRDIPVRAKRLISGSPVAFDARFLAEEARGLTSLDDPVDRALLAGYCDGDASVYLRRELGHSDRKSPKYGLAPNLCVGSLAVASQLANLLDSGAPIPRKDENGDETVYVVTAYASKAVRLLRTILPYSFKAGQIEILLEFQERHHRHGTGGPGNTLPTSVLVWRDAAWKALAHLRDHQPIAERLRSVLSEGGDFASGFPRASAESDYYATEH